MTYPGCRQGPISVPKPPTDHPSGLQTKQARRLARSNDKTTPWEESYRTTVVNPQPTGAKLAPTRTTRVTGKTRLDTDPCHQALQPGSIRHGSQPEATTPIYLKNKKSKLRHDCKLFHLHGTAIFTDCRRSMTITDVPHNPSRPQTRTRGRWTL